MNSDEAYDDLRQRQLEAAHENLRHVKPLHSYYWMCTDGEAFPEAEKDKAISYQYQLERENNERVPVEILTVGQVRRRRLKKRLQIIASKIVVFLRPHPQK